MEPEMMEELIAFVIRFVIGGLVPMLIWAFVIVLIFRGLKKAGLKDKHRDKIMQQTEDVKQRQQVVKEMISNEIADRRSEGERPSDDDGLFDNDWLATQRRLERKQFKQIYGYDQEDDLTRNAFDNAKYQKAMHQVSCDAYAQKVQTRKRKQKE